LAPESLRFVAVEAMPIATAATATVAIEIQVHEVSLRLPPAVGPAFLAEFVARLAERPPC
jgi:hypothetical protein